MNWQEIAQMTDRQQQWIVASKKVHAGEIVLAGSYPDHADPWYLREAVACSRVLRELVDMKDLSRALGTAFAHLLDLSRQTEGQRQLALDMVGWRRHPDHPWYVRKEQ